ncbi:hypothetical protein [Streptomyces chartreusis]|uniref:hypothetical protein n=1 Tax=Streptomyces chartreusis TaxID=1969 RepID=UPI00362DF5DB
MASRVIWPVEAVHGIGRRQAVVLTGYGIHSVGLLASVPPATGPRLVGRPAPAATRRTGPAPAAPATVRHVFPRLTLGGAEARADLLETVVRLGLLLPRPDGPRPDAEAVFAGGGRWEKTWRLAEPFVHDDDLRLTPTS